MTRVQTAASRSYTVTALLNVILPIRKQCILLWAKRGDFIGPKTNVTLSFGIFSLYNQYLLRIDTGVWNRSDRIRTRLGQDRVPGAGGHMVRTGKDENIILN